MNSQSRSITWFGNIFTKPVDRNYARNDKNNYRENPKWACVVIKYDFRPDLKPK